MFNPTVRQLPMAVLASIPVLCLFLLCALLTPTAVVAAALDDAQEAWNRGNGTEAIVRLKSLLQGEPQNLAARILLGEVYLESGAAAAAEYELDRARRAGAAEVEVLPRLVDALLAQAKLAEVLELTAGYEEAIPELQTVLLTQRAEALLAQDNLDAAAAAFGHAVRADPKAARPVLGLANVAQRLGDTERHRELVEQAIALDPGSVLAWTAKATLELDTGQPDAAIAAYTQALAHAPGRWQLHYLRARARIDAGDPAGAAEDIASVREELPRFAGISYVEGRLQLIDGNARLAAETLERYVRAAPDDPRGLYFAALALSGSGQFVKAREYLERLVAAYPDEPRAAILLAMTRLETGDPAGAEQLIGHFARGNSARPEAVELLRRALVMQERNEEAAALVERAVEQFPELVSARIALATQLLERGRPAEAAETLLAALSRDPANQRAWDLLVRAEVEAGDIEAARTASTDFLDRFPESPLAHTLSGGLLAEKGDVDAAKAALLRALELDPSFTRASLALAGIRLTTEGQAAAGETLNALIEHDPANAEALLALAGLQGVGPREEVYVDGLKEALRADPNNLQIRTTLAGHHLTSGQFEAVLDLVQRAPATQRGQGSLMVLRALAERAAGRTAQANAVLTELAKTNPNSPRFRYLLAIDRAYAGDYAVTETHLRDGLELDKELWLQPRQLEAILSSLPPDPRTQTLLDRLLVVAPEHPAVVLTAVRQLLNRDQFDRKPGDVDEARALAERLYRRHPNNELVTLEYARSLVTAGRREDAIGVLTDWIERHPDAINMRLLVAVEHLKEGSTELAAEQYRAVEKLDPNNATTLNNLAWLNVKDDPEVAMVYVQRALTLIPEHPAFLDTLGAVLLAQGKPEEALAPLAKAYTALAAPAFALHYAEALARTGSDAEARRVLMQSTEWPANEKAKAEALLKELPGDR